MKPIYFAIILMVSSLSAAAQLAVKTNLLYDATTTPNLGAEVGIKPDQTINLVYGLNPWTFHDSQGRDRKARHWLVQPEWRWWLCSRFNGHFVGVHAMGGQFNASRVNLPIPGAFFGGDNIAREVRNTRYQGAFAGAGVTYGYQFILSRSWNLEAEVGVGYNHVWYSRYACGECGGKLYTGQTNYVGLTKLGLSFLYLF